MKISIMAVLTAIVFVSGCATVARYTLQDRFRAIGIPAGTADCMVEELEQRLTSEDIQDLARYTVNLARADSTFAAIRALMQIDNPRAVTAIGASGVSCVTGLRL
ncbi:MAG: hypothetical protein GXP04_06540 [Alphaproteobacteria bacterium]|nr:hypothetical protein [Alphaproteobacteria bacterium]